MDEAVSNEDLKKFEQKYHEELNHGKVGGRLSRLSKTSTLQPFPFTTYNP